MLHRLEEEGIKAYLKDEHSVTIHPGLTNAIGGIKLMIFEEQVERALGLITEFERAYRESVACPDCGSTNIHHITKPNNVTNWFTALITWMFGNYAISFRHVYKCFDCGYESDIDAGKYIKIVAAGLLSKKRAQLIGEN